MINWDLNGIVIEYQKIIEVSKISQQNNSETVASENDKEAPKEISKESRVSPDERPKILLIILILI